MLHQVLSKQSKKEENFCCTSLCNTCRLKQQRSTHKMYFSFCEIKEVAASLLLIGASQIPPEIVTVAASFSLPFCFCCRTKEGTTKSRQRSLGATNCRQQLCCYPSFSASFDRPSTGGVPPLQLRNSQLDTCSTAASRCCCCPFVFQLSATRKSLEKVCWR